MSIADDKSGHAVNSCRVCASLGAILAFKGLEGCVPLIHGSQGCATYVRRYMISHFREPVDVASSSFSEEAAVFGGGESLKKAIINVAKQYNPSSIGVATTCLTETIGEDVKAIVKSICTENPSLPQIILAPVPSYAYSYEEGYRVAAAAAVEKLAAVSKKDGSINFFSTVISPADIRLLKEYIRFSKVDGIVFPDFSLSLDGGQWEQYTKLPSGGTHIADLRKSPAASGTIEMGFNPRTQTPGLFLENNFAVNKIQIPLPVGISLSDRFMESIEEVSGKAVPENIMGKRGRLIDSYIDGHKYVYGARVAVLGEPAIVASMLSFILETGMKPVMCATGSNKGQLIAALKLAGVFLSEDCMVFEDTDYETLSEKCEKLQVDIIFGNSKCYRLAKTLKAPLLRIGFPVHDRFGGARIMHILYDGAQELFDRSVNALLDKKQEQADMSYSYM